MFKLNTLPFFKKNLISFLCLFVIIFLQIIKKDPILIENYYSTSFYKISSQIPLYLFGKLPFSFGDILYLLNRTNWNRFGWKVDSTELSRDGKNIMHVYLTQNGTNNGTGTVSKSRHLIDIFHRPN